MDTLLMERYAAEFRRHCRFTAVFAAIFATLLILIFFYFAYADAFSCRRRRREGAAAAAMPRTLLMPCCRLPALTPLPRRYADAALLFRHADTLYNNE